MPSRSTITGRSSGRAESPGARRAMEAMLKMKKLDIATLKRAFEG
jgi:predicted 3-demethylubiquinone-9 3-methyltransferase (glyoxalase superfamily)